MRTRLINTVVVIVLGTGAGNIRAITLNLAQIPTWSSNGAPAANCSFSYPTLQPLSQQRTLLVDNSLPNGSVLYSWGYNDFAPGFITMCNTATTVNTNVISTRPGGTEPESFFNTSLYFRGRWSNNYHDYYWLTNNPGIGLKLYVTPTTINAQNTGYPGGGMTSQVMITGNQPAQVGQEYTILQQTNEWVQPSFKSKVLIASPGFQHHMGADINYVSYSVRGELVKIGNVQPSSNLSISSGSLSHTHSIWVAGSPNTSTTSLDVPTIFGAGGITIAAPACRLRGVTDYQVNLERWTDVAGRNTGVLPAYGAIKPIDLNIECSGKVNNVKFSFQDAGTNGLLNQNISVYDNGGQYIEGLEIEMSYNGSRIDVNSTASPSPSYPVSTGSKGQVKSNAEDLSYNSQDTAQFGARFVQRSAIKRNGTSYTGPVTGQVNMTVTYE
ncbi:TPA: hypothetical protein N2R15_003519 [Citrobacter amalonaticus]|nr:hypothetical protein [Citrobacter amalonaticus]